MSIPGEFPDGDAQDCVYQVIHSNIHEFVFLKPTPLAVQQWADRWGEILSGTAPDQTLYTLLDTRPGLPPMQPMIQRSKQLIARLPARPQTRTAILAKYHIFLSIAQDLSQPLLRTQSDVVKYFAVHERDTALAWLKR
jgi:hypothetical protein